MRSYDVFFSPNSVGTLRGSYGSYENTEVETRVVSRPHEVSRWKVKKLLRLFSSMCVARVRSQGAPAGCRRAKWQRPAVKSCSNSSCTAYNSHRWWSLVRPPKLQMLLAAKGAAVPLSQLGGIRGGQSLTVCIGVVGLSSACGDDRIWNPTSGELITYRS